MKIFQHSSSMKKKVIQVTIKFTNRKISNKFYLISIY